MMETSLSANRDAHPCEPMESTCSPAGNTSVLRELEDRLRNTHAVAFFDKLTLSARVDDLYLEFARHHRGDDGLSLDSLRAQFDQLFNQVLAMVESRDPQLHRDIAHVRPRVWDMFTDPQVFARIPRSSHGGQSARD